MQYHLQPWGPMPSWSLKQSWCSLPQSWGAWLSWGCYIPHRRPFQLGHRAGEKVTRTCQAQGHSKLQPVSTLPSTPHPVTLAHAAGLCPCWSLLLGLSFSLLIPLPSNQLPSLLPFLQVFLSLFYVSGTIAGAGATALQARCVGDKIHAFVELLFLFGRQRDKEQNR